MSIIVCTNIYPCAGLSYLGAFVKDDVELLKSNGLSVNVKIVRGRKAGGSTFQYFGAVMWALSKRINNEYRDDVGYSHHAFCTLLLKVAGVRRIVYINHEGEWFKRHSYIEKVKLFVYRYVDYAIFVNRRMFDSFDSDRKVFAPCIVDVNGLFKSNGNRFSWLAEKKYIFFPASPDRAEKNYKRLSSLITKYRFFFDRFDIEVVTGGQIPRGEIGWFYKYAIATVVCSDFESDGLAFKESLLCGTPFISHDVGNAREYSSYGGYIFDSDESFFSALIGCFLCPPVIKPSDRWIDKQARFDLLSKCFA